MKEAISKSDFTDWKSNAVTYAVFSAIKERQMNLKELLASSAGLDPVEDRKVAGMIAAYNTLLLIDWEDVSDE
jgi:hypothetical protein